MFWMARVPDNNSEVYDVGDRRLTINTSSGFFNFPNPPQFFTVNFVKSILLDGNT